jgi:SAM-dependent methyltransferase
MTINIEGIRPLLERGNWYHTFEVCGIKTPGTYDYTDVLPTIEIPNIKGKTILDVGCSDGFFSMYFERHGARVKGLDSNAYDGKTAIENLLSYDAIFQKKYSNNSDYKRFESIYSTLGLANSNKFNLIKNIFDLDMEFIQGSCYDLNKIERHDVVFCGSLIEHLRDPVTAIEQMYLNAREFVIIDLSSVMPKIFNIPRLNLMRYTAGGGSFYKSLSKSNWSAYLVLEPD